MSSARFIVRRSFFGVAYFLLVGNLVAEDIDGE